MEESTRKRTGLRVAILVILGFMAGAILGLLLGWIVWPVSYTDTTIADLAPEYKDEYILMVASACAADGNVEEAQARLAKLDVPNVNQSISALIDRSIGEGRPEANIQALAGLANALGVTSPQMLAYLATPTPEPTDTPSPTPTPLPTDTSTPTPLPTDTPIPTDTPVPPSDTPVPEPTSTPIPPTNTAKPKPANTAKPQPTSTPKPTNPPAPKWTWSAYLFGPANQPNQACEEGAQYVRVTVLNAGGGQIGGVWVHDLYQGLTQVTGHKAGESDWGEGEAEIPCPGRGGEKLCIAADQGGACISDYTRDLTCFWTPSFEDLWAAGYCNCCEVGISKEQCQQLYDSGAGCMLQPRHYSWHVTFKRSQ